MGAEIWIKVGEPSPTALSELSFLSVDTRTPYVAEAEFTGPNGVKTAHYMLRWLNTRGEARP